MPTWSQVRAHLRTRFQLRRDDDTELELAWAFPDAVEAQRQIVTAKRALDRPALVIRCETALAAFTEREALAHNATLAVGAIAFVEDGYVVRHVVFLDELATFAALERDLELVAHEAARLRRHRHDTPEAASVFRNYAD